MATFAIGVSYEGTAFHGWQRQRDLPTIQGALEQAVSRIADSPVQVQVAGRTDAGVHATGQVAGFSSDATRSMWDWQRGINALTPQAISVDWVQPVDAVFHPRYSATARRYIYVFYDSGVPEPLIGGRGWVCDPLDADAMHRAAQHLVGEHDFSSFRGAGCQSLTPMRRVHHCVVRRHGRWVTMDIEANAFVLHMVRNIAAGLFAVGTGADGPAIDELLAARDRTQLGPTAPAHGLYLQHVSYPGFDLPPGKALPWVGF